MSGDDEGRDGVMILQAEECQRSPANHGKLGQRPGPEPPLTLQEEATLVSIQEVRPHISVA